jgi:hypothetical protein
MTREEWETKQNSLKKNIKYVPTGNPGEVVTEEINPKDYETNLSPKDEEKFQVWLDEKYKKGHIQKGDYDFYKANNYGYSYDFRAAFKNKDAGGISPVDNEWHWSDYGKKPNHETFSNESVYYPKVAAPGVGGSWGGEDGENYIKNPSIGAPVPPAKQAFKK